MVTEPVVNQLIIFLYTILTGALVVFMYDFYAGCGHVLRLRKTGLALGDLIYWLVVLALVYSLLLRFNQGEVRFHVLLELGLGAGLYFLLFRHRVRYMITRLLELIVRIISWVLWFLARIVALVLLPVRILIQGLCYPFCLLGLLLGKAGSGIKARFQKMIGHFIKKQPPSN